MNNEIKKYCEYCKLYSSLGCQSTLICNNGNKFLATEAQPVKRGRWENEYLEDDDVWWADCTNCKNETHSKFGRVSSYTFCPNCGARMVGEQK